MIQRIDCAGGGQIVVDGKYAYIAHMKGPTAVTVFDVGDPNRPREIASIPIPRTDMHCHKVQVHDGIMITNYEKLRGASLTGDIRGGLKIYDVSAPAKPELITFWECGGKGAHRFTYDGKYAYVSPEVEGYDGNICMILDLQDPTKPTEIGRWHAPGQWHAGGEERTWPSRSVRCHHAIRQGDRLYVSYWHGGWFLLDISDMTKPRKISGMVKSPPLAWPTHSCLPIPFEIKGRKIMLVADEDVDKLYPAGPAFLWAVDITDENHPMPYSSFQIPGIDASAETPWFYGCHQPVEHVRGTEVPVAWFSQGLRVVDIADPENISEVAFYIPAPYPGAEQTRTNDVYEDDRGLIYVLDRIRGLDIVERI